MLELPEGITLAKQMNEHLIGKTVRSVLPPTKQHKFCWFAGDPAEYSPQIADSSIQSVNSFGIYVELTFSNGRYLCFNDGVNPRLMERENAPKQYQLLIELDDDTALVFTVAMYGGIFLHDGSYDNPYYLKSKQAISPFSKEFEPYFYSVLEQSKPALSAKAFLATKQRFPGIGNGALQDILLSAEIHPKRKIMTLNREEKERLFSSVLWVLSEMTTQGGRDTEKDLFGQPGGYRVKLSKNTLSSGCVQCGTGLIKESYLGGAIYFCPACQPLVKE